MTDDTLVVPAGDSADGGERPDAQLDETPAVAQRAPTTIIGSIHAEIEDVESSDTKDLRVGKIRSLWARYRVLTRDERTELERAGRARRALKSKVSRAGADIEAGEEELRAARLLVKSLQELLWQRDDGELVPLADGLREEGIDVEGPLRYNAELIEVLDLGELLGISAEDRPSAIEVVTALHRWGEDHMPLLTNARVLSTWMSAVTAEALEGVIEGM